jgi:hypothetical protein
MSHTRLYIKLQPDMSANIRILWDVTPYILVDMCQSLHREGSKRLPVNTAWNNTAYIYTTTENKIDSNAMFGEVIGRLQGFPE